MPITPYATGSRKREMATEYTVAFDGVSGAGALDVDAIDAPDEGWRVVVTAMDLRVSTDMTVTFKDGATAQLAMLGSVYLPIKDRNRRGLFVLTEATEFVINVGATGRVTGPITYILEKL